MGYCGGNRNYMDEMRQLICEIEKLKPEPEVCNVRCPPFGCPRGPCMGMCSYEGISDPCCVSEMPCCPPAPHPPRCCAPSCLSYKNKSSNIHSAAPLTCSKNHPICPSKAPCPPRPCNGPSTSRCSP